MAFEQYGAAVDYEHLTEGSLWKLDYYCYMLHRTDQSTRTLLYGNILGELQVFTSVICIAPPKVR